MRAILLLLVTLMLITAVSAQEFIRQTLGRGELPENSDIGTVAIVCTSKCTVSGVNLPADATSVKMVVTDSSNTEIHSETISVVGPATNQSYTTNTDLTQGSDNTLTFYVINDSNSVVATATQDELVVMSSLKSKLDTFTDGDDSTNSNFSSSDIVSAFFSAGESAVMSDIESKLTILNAELAENDHSCSLAGGNSPSDTQVGDYLECVMVAHYKDELAVHVDVADPTAVEGDDGGLTVAFSDNVATLCNETIWMCSIEDTDSDGWSISGSEAVLSNTEVNIATSTYANALDSDFSLKIALATYPSDSISSSLTTKNYTSVDVPAPAILAELLQATPSVSADANFAGLGLDSNVLTDLQANRTVFNTEIASESFASTDTCGTTTISSTSTRPTIGDYVECVMRSHYEDVAEAITVLSSNPISGKTACDTGIKGPIPSLCSEANWSCAISAKTPSDWAYTDNNNVSTKPVIDTPDSDGDPVDDAQYTITATLSDYSPTLTKTYQYSDIDIPGRSVSSTVNKTGSSIGNAVNACTNSGHRLALASEISNLDSGTYRIYATDTSQTNPNCNSSSWTNISWMRVKTTSSNAQTPKMRDTSFYPTKNKMWVYNNGTKVKSNCKHSNISTVNDWTAFCRQITYTCD